MSSTTEEQRRLIKTSAFTRLEKDRFTFGGRSFSPSEIVEMLAEYMTEERTRRIEEVLDGRTYNVATVVEGLINLGNVSAVMRSAEGLGFQPFHIVTGDAVFKNSSRTSQGAEKWLDVHQWRRAADCGAYLKSEGYRIVVTHLDERSVPIDDVDFTEKAALVFGNEAEGVSEEMLSLADERVVVPMVGFVQSFNISVAAAVSLYHAYQERVARLGAQGDLTEAQKNELRAAFYLRSVRSAERILLEASQRRERG